MVDCTVKLWHNSLFYLNLQHYQSTGRMMIGALNAGSNITGVLTNTNAFSALLHKYNALAFWDYAAAAPYVKIDMNPPNNELAYKDGVYFSMHKFVGGPDSPGVYTSMCTHERKLCQYFAFCMCVYTL